jgi:hypothetical protein
MFPTRKPILTLKVDGHVIRTTADHPFYVQGQGWTPADHLQAGDLLHTQDGQNLHVEAVTAGDEEQVVSNLPLPGSMSFLHRPVIGFMAGTPLLTPEGFKRIEDIKPGDVIQTQPDDQGDDKPGAEPGLWDSN